MQFNNPNILYVLFALLIPIIVHLFQLRKFQKTDFTNVKFLKELVVKTRKSSQLKKWLLLACRLLIFVCIILAFSEPYFTQKDTPLQKPETVFYIDNSFSNQEKGGKGELLKVTIQELLENYPNDEKISIITNTRTFKNKILSDIKTDLIDLEYSPYQLDYKSVTLKAEQSIDCFQTFSKEIVVLDIPTAISENSSNKKVKAWINNNTLLIKNTQKANISIRNVVGQVLFNENGKNNHAFDLSKISSQMLIINIYDNLNTAPIKINFIKK